MPKLKLAVLISGSGTNLQALIDACKAGDLQAEIALVISNKHDAGGLARAEKAGIKTVVINHKEFSSREEFDKKMDAEINASGAKFVCMAGFMRLLSPWFVDKWHNKLVNIHPSLLPSFKGVDAQKQAIDYGVKITGCTVHFVRREMDVGPIIVQKAINILPGDDAGSLRDRLLVEEHAAYAEAMKIIASGKYEIVGEKVVLK